MVNAINSIGQPLLIGSIALILYGMKSFGSLPLALATLGGVGLYSGMYLLSMSISMIATSSIALGAAYAMAYGRFIRRPSRKEEGH